jgi:cytoplasmic iron level regulating protein YaaA (DUF328/UPF0246 family)
MQCPVAVVISPAKSQRDASVVAAIKKHVDDTIPRYRHKADELADLLRKKSASQISALMGISGPLAAGVVDKYAAYKADSEIGVQAALLYDGPAYRGLEFESLSAKECRRAAECLRFLSALYGILKPCDAVQSYRLEMSVKPGEIGLVGPKSLASHWCGDVSAEFNHILKSNGDAILVNAASEEYSKAISIKDLNPGIKFINIRFLDDGKVKSAYAKKARGQYSRFIVQKSADTGTMSIDQLKEFDTDGYAFSKRESSTDVFVFTRSGGGGPSKKKQKL